MIGLDTNAPTSDRRKPISATPSSDAINRSLGAEYMVTFDRDLKGVKTFRLLWAAHEIRRMVVRGPVAQARRSSGSGSGTRGRRLGHPPKRGRSLATRAA